MGFPSCQVTKLFIHAKSSLDREVDHARIGVGIDEKGSDEDEDIDIGKFRLGGDGFSWVQETPKYGRSPFIGGTLYASGPRIYTVREGR